MLRLGGVGGVVSYILIGKEGAPLLLATPPPSAATQGGFSKRNQDLRETKRFKGKGKM